MVSNSLTARKGLPRSPVVCRAPPKPPIRPLELSLVPVPDTITIYDLVNLHFWGDHPTRPIGEDITCDFDPGPGYLDPPPATKNRTPSAGTWFPPSAPCQARIAVTALWCDGTKAFAFCFVTVTLD